MYRVLLFFFCLVLSSSLQAQARGNINRAAAGNSNYTEPVRYPENTISTPTPTNPNVLVSVRALANVPADSYVAIFTSVQTGETTKEVNTLMDARIQGAGQALKKQSSLEFFVDMISFVPLYEFEVEKKVFSKKTYNELPIGFELKKNLHISFSKAEQLDEIIRVLADSEIYDLVRVDYYSKDLGAAKRDLAKRSAAILKEKTAFYEGVLGYTIDTASRYISDSYRVFLPTEQYQSYTAYSSSSLTTNKKRVEVNRADKMSSQYYQPVMDKEFDLVLNPVVLEPCIQVLYELKLHFVPAPKPAAKPQSKPEKEYFLISPNGDLKSIRVE